MQFTDLYFVLFFAAVFLLYYILPCKCRPFLLLAASFVFYAVYSVKLLILFAAEIAVTYLFGLFLGKTGPALSEADAKKHKKPAPLRKAVFAAGLVFVFGVLFVFKYLTFTLRSLGAVLPNLSFLAEPERFNIVLPMGISFYTFQAVGYLVDVYKGRTPAEKNPVMYALFLSFFPQLVAGPIERSNRLLPQIKYVAKHKAWDYDRVIRGGILMLWGYFMKLMIADRASYVVDFCFSDDAEKGSVELLLGVFFFSIQIYCDFASYSCIAVGSAKIFGIDLTENFDTPYFSLSVNEFWKRWHISLTGWFRDYIYIPLGGNQKGKARKYRNILLVFLISGLWHGADWSFVVWGLLHGFYQLIGDLTRPLKDKLNDRWKVNTQATSYKMGKVVVTYLLTGFAWVFFRAESVQAAFAYITALLTKPDPWVLSQGILFDIGLERMEMNLLLVSILILFIIDGIKRIRNVSIDHLADRQNVWFRPLLIIVLLMTVLIFGTYGLKYDAKQFMYFEF